MLTVILVSAAFGMGFGLVADAIILAGYYLGVKLGWWY